MEKNTTILSAFISKKELRRYFFIFTFPSDEKISVDQAYQSNSSRQKKRENLLKRKYKHEFKHFHETFQAPLKMLVTENISKDRA